MSNTPLTDALREHEDLDSLDDVIESHEKLERALTAKTAECERLREDSEQEKDIRRMFALAVLAAGGGVWITKLAMQSSPTLIREDFDGDIHYTAVDARKETP